MVLGPDVNDWFQKLKKADHELGVASVIALVESILLLDGIVP